MAEQLLWQPWKCYTMPHMHSIEHGCLGHKNTTSLAELTPQDKLLIPENYLISS
jgi:hypothetical protein